MWNATSVMSSAASQEMTPLKMSSAAPEKIEAPAT